MIRGIPVIKFFRTPRVATGVELVVIITIFSIEIMHVLCFMEEKTRFRAPATSR